jgi:cbb3-type cytochrome c oxidase subunit II
VANGRAGNLCRRRKSRRFPIARSRRGARATGLQPSLAGIQADVLDGLALVAVLIGGMIEIIPMIVIKENVPTISSVKPYTPLELLGRDIYIREGCLGCHSQMIRPFRSETERYGEYSKAGEFVYDHPFLWGSKRIGPDLHRVGGKYPDAWHYNHMDDPRSTSPGSIMPRYSWLLTQTLDTTSLPARISALRRVGVPYPPGYEDKALDELNKQAGQGRGRPQSRASQGAARPRNHRRDRLFAAAWHGHQIGAKNAGSGCNRTARQQLIQTL